jgi:hypothetical protein
MLQRAADSAVLTAFSLLYSCAVLLLKRRAKRLASRPHPGAAELEESGA